MECDASIDHYGGFLGAWLEAITGAEDSRIETRKADGAIVLISVNDRHFGFTPAGVGELTRILEQGLKQPPTDDEREPPVREGASNLVLSLRYFAGEIEKEKAPA